jgi:hypothetical protein
MRGKMENISDLTRLLDDFVSNGELSRQSADLMIRRVERGIRILEREFPVAQANHCTQDRTSRAKHRSVAVTDC